MKYNFQSAVQNYGYSCYNELSADMLETLQYIVEQSDNFSFVTIILHKDKALKLLEQLFQSTWQDKQLEVHPDYAETYNDDLKGDVISISICNDGYIFADTFKMWLKDGSDFVYIDDSLDNADEIVQKYRTGEGEDFHTDYIIRFTML